MQMKAIAVFPNQKAVRLIDHEEPEIAAPNQVKMRMLEVGICGTDRDITSFQYGFPPDGFEYLILGHESLGEVVETGADVKSVKPGDLVVTTVRRPCTHDWCIPCGAGRQDFCASGDYTERGIKQRHGFMAEFVVEEERYLNAVPRELRDHAVLTEPLTIAEKSLLQLWKIQERLPWGCPHTEAEGPGHCHKAVVLGAGPVGLLGAMALRVDGFDVTVYSRTHTHENGDPILAAIGAKFIPAETNTVDQMAQQVGRIDVVYEAVGASSLAFDVLKHLGPNAIFIFTGVPGLHAPIPVDADHIMRDMVLNNQVAIGSVNAPPESFAAAIRDLTEFQKRWPDAISKLITGRFPIDQAVDPLTKNFGGIKNIITIAA
ncbi:MAG TPA: glucose 1-dehydrogenase [Bryobacteraceae bacterium]|nr:glucose 1-dehydrogenase [Bryobacteraceae bacterium]